jgi:hypothetical protein
MSIIATATDTSGRSISVVWAAEVEVVEIRTDRDVVYLDPADARVLARHLESAAEAADIYVQGRSA